MAIVIIMVIIAITQAFILKGFVKLVMASIKAIT